MSKAKQEVNINDEIYNYLMKSNRPYSVQDILNNLHKEFGKTAITKALDALVSKEKVKEKSYGKQKVYFVNQDLMPKVADEVIREIDANIVDLSAKLKTAQQELKVKEFKLRAISSSLTEAELKEKIDRVSSEIDRLQKKLDMVKVKGPQTGVSANLTALKKAHENYANEWRKRKRVANVILDMILDGYPKGKKALYEEIGIELDE